MIAASGIKKQYGQKTLYKNGNFQLNEGEKIGLVGPNGNGKTTLFRLITQEESPDEGSISKPDRIRIAYFSQNIEDMHGKSALDEVKSASPRIDYIVQKLKEIEHSLSEVQDDQIMNRLLETYGELQSEFEQLGGYDLESRAAEILTGLGIGPEDYHRDTGSFSGGWKMRIALAKVLAQNPEVLLMDEPTNHLDIESIVWLESWISSFKGTVLMTSHDRDFMNRLVTKIIEISNQQITVYGGNYDFYDKERALRLEQLIAAHKRQEEMLSKEEEFISRFAARASHAAQVQSRVKKLEKIDRIEIPTEERQIQFVWPTPARGGDEVVKFQDLGKIWPASASTGKEKLVFKGASGLIKRCDRIAVVGVNGAGKSTFLKIIAGHTNPSHGVCKVGSSIEVGYFSQNSLDVLNPNNTVIDEVHAHIPTMGLGTVRTLLGAFKFSGEEAEKKISILSGGEKSRVVLATILARPVNLLILDEPTNHLDIASRELLMEAIDQFQGTVIMVSHDRFFLRKLTKRVFELDQNKLTTYDGDYHYYTEKKKALLL